MQQPAIRVSGAALLGIVMLISGCASLSASSYPTSQAATALRVRYGEVVHVSPVEIEGEPTVLGRLGGAWVGYALGRGDQSIFESGRRLQSSVGGVAGAVAGEAVERRARSSDGLQIVVRFSNQETMAVVQAADIPFSPGDPVQVLIAPDGTTRVQPI